MTVVAAGLSQPTAIDFLPDGGMLITEQAGFVKRLPPGASKTENVLNLSDEVNGVVERGLTGLAIDPGFESNGFIYLLYTYDEPGQERGGDGPRLGHLVRFTLRDGVAEPDSRRVLLEGFESDVPFHSAGTVRIGADGLIYASFGDSSNPYAVSDLALRSQDLDQLQGKIVRIDRDGRAVPVNPFFDPARPDSIRSKVLSYGYRNPFRFRMHPQTGAMYVGNVGWQTIESIVRDVPGGNFGWPCFESVRQVPEFEAAPPCQGLSLSQLMRADHDYTHNGDAASLTVGDFAGAGFPPEMRGNLFFGDYSQKWVRRAILDDGGQISRVEEFGRGLGFPVELTFGPDGALYLVDYLGGMIKRIVYEPARSRPTARLDAAADGAIRLADGALSGPAPLSVVFSAAGSADADGEELRYAWDFDAARDAIGTNSSRLQVSPLPTVTHVFEAPGDYVARVTVLDESDWLDAAEQRITVQATKPLPSIISPGDGETFITGSAVELTGQAIGLDGQPLPAGALRWTATAHDRWWGRRTLATGEGERFAFIMPAAAAVDAPARLEELSSVVVTLSARDDAGRAGETRITLRPQPRDGYIRTWWLIGGFPNASLSSDVLPGGEAAFTVDRNAASARLIQSVSRKIDLAAYFQPAQSTMAYAFIWIDSPAERDALLGMTSDDGIAVWLNGEEVWRNSVARYVPDDMRDLDLPKVRLRAGPNSLLVNVDQKFGEWAFKLRVLNPNGSVMRDVTVRTERR